MELLWMLRGSQASLWTLRNPVVIGDVMLLERSDWLYKRSRTRHRITYQVIERIIAYLQNR